MGAHGQGTKVPIQTRRKDGTIRRRVRVVVTMADGRRVWRTVVDDRAADRMRATLVEARELDLDPSRLTRQTLEDYLRSWLRGQRDAKRRRIRERTLIGYQALIERRIIPELGHLRLSQLTRRRIQEWVERSDGSAGTVRNAHAVLRKALAGLVGDVLPANPAIGVELPERVKYSGSPLTADEAHRLLEVTVGDRLHAFWRLALTTGLRESELLGLARDALDGATLKVEHQLQRIGGRWVLGPTKAVRGLEVIELDAETARIVRAHLAAMTAERSPRWRYFGLMFVTEQGEPYHQSRILDEFHRACVRAGFARRRVHDLRGTAATLLVDLGVPEETRMARLGHNTKAMARHYGQASRRQDRAAAEQLAEALDG